MWVFCLFFLRCVIFTFILFVLALAFFFFFMKLNFFFFLPFVFRCQARSGSPRLFWLLFWDMTNSLAKVKQLFISEVLEAENVCV